MDSLLDALQEGRLIELPEDDDKEESLRILARILEAIPSLPAGLDIEGLILDRERTSYTSLGHGWACPHARVSFEGDLMCVVGWSAHGITYSPEDQTRVSIIIMHLVPENQRNQYLREVSILAKAIQSDPKWREITTAKDLTEVRDRLLDLISSAKDTVGPAARARMIRLQRPKVEPSPITDLSNLVIEPVTLIVGPDFRPIVLTQHAGLAKYLETAIDVAEKIETDGVFQNGGWRIIRRSKIVFQNGRVSYDCLAITTARKPDSKER